MIDTIQAYVYPMLSVPENLDIPTEKNNKMIIKQTRGKWRQSESSKTNPFAYEKTYMHK